MTPMFSAYVVVPDPPPSPATTVASPSPTYARPIVSSSGRSVIDATALTCPVFSATSTSTTGSTSTTACSVNRGAVNSGSPTQSASRTAPSRPRRARRTARSRRRTPSTIDSRPSSPREATVTTTTTSSVDERHERPGLEVRLRATGARLSPISSDDRAGHHRRQQPLDEPGAHRLHEQRRRARAARRPTTMPPSASGMPPSADAAGHGRDEGEARAEVGRQPVAGDAAGTAACRCRRRRWSCSAGSRSAPARGTSRRTSRRTCCSPMPIVYGQASRSSGRTTASGRDGAAVAVQGPDGHGPPRRSMGAAESSGAPYYGRGVRTLVVDHPLVAPQAHGAARRAAPTRRPSGGSPTSW